MTGLAQCVLALAAIVSCGCAAVRALGVEWRAGAWLWVPGAGVLFGLGAYSLGFAAVLLSVGPEPIALAAKDAALAGLGILAWRRVRLLARVPGTPAAAASPWTRVAWTILAGAIVVTVGAWVLQARAAPDGDWDAWMIWNLRARFLASAPDLARVFAPSLAFTHLDYPLMVPGIVTSFWRIAATEPAWIPAALSGVFALSAACTVAGMTARLTGDAAGALAGLTVLGAPYFTGQGAAQCSDVPLAAFAALSATLVACALASQGPSPARTLALAGASASLAAWTKNEGLLFFVTGCAALALTPGHPGEPRRDRHRRAAHFLAGGVPALLILLWFKSTLAGANDLVVRNSLHAALERLTDAGRYGQIAAAMLAESVNTAKWAGLPVALACAMPVLWIAGGRPRVPSVVRVLASWLAAVAAGYFLVYVLTPHDLAWHLTTSLDRLFIQFWPSAVFLAFLVLTCTVPRGRAPARPGCR